MDLNDFKIKHAEWIEKGVITFEMAKSVPDLSQVYKLFFKSENIVFITIDRFINGDFVTTKEVINKIRSDVRKMGYVKTMLGIGMYQKELH